MLTENRHTTLMGLQVGENTAKKSKRKGQKPEKIDPNLICGIREATNNEKTALIEATNSWEIFHQNIAYSGTAHVARRVDDTV